MELLKVNDFIVCDNPEYMGIGYAKVIKITDKITKEEFDEYGPVIRGLGDKNSNLDITVQYVGYEMDDSVMVDGLDEIADIDIIKVINPHSIYQIITEEMISQIKDKWEYRMTAKLDFFYKHLDKPILEGRKSINTLKIIKNS